MAIKVSKKKSLSQKNGAKRKKKRRKQKKEPNEVGRPTEYVQEMCDEAKAFCLLGYTDEKLAKALGISERTLNNWKKKHPEFMQAVRQGKEYADAVVAQTLFEKAQNGDLQATIFWLKNRQPELWNNVSLKITQPGKDGNDGSSEEGVVPIIGIIINP